MRCEHCGKEIADDSRFCKYCGKDVYVTPEIVDDIPHRAPNQGKSGGRVCPRCGSHHVMVYVGRTGYSPGCGCLGLLLFGWLGLLLGLLGMHDKVTLVCSDCGYSETVHEKSTGCCGVIVLILLILLIAAAISKMG